MKMTYFAVSKKLVILYYISNVMGENKKIKIVLLTILLLGAFLRFWGIQWGLPYEYQSEEYKIIKYALKMGSGDLNPHFFEYPSLYLYFMLFLFGMYFVAGKIFGIFASVHAFALEFIKDITSFYLIGRICEALFSLGVILLIYRIAKELFSKRMALLAAFCMAILPIAVQRSHYIKGDQAAIFLGLLFWWFAYQLYKTGENKYYYLSGILLGLAISTKYYMAMMGITLITAHILSQNKFWNRHFITSLSLIPIFFFIGSPYALLSHEFKDFIVNFKSIFFKFEPSEPLLLHSGYLERMGKAGINLIRMDDSSGIFMIGGYGLGILNLSGIVLLLREKKQQAWMLIAPILTYWLIVSCYHSPAAGYLAPIFPLWILCGTFFVSYFLPKMLREGSNVHLIKAGIAGTFIFSVISAFGESALLSYQYTLTDTRTLAKEWIESHVPERSKVLIDLVPNSPPLEMTREQLEKFYQIASKSNHYKKEFFKLKLEAVRSDQISYEIFVLKKTPAEIGSLSEQVEQVQMTQDLFEATGESIDIENLKKTGIKVVIINGWAEQNAREKIPRVARFYQEIFKKGKLLKIFEPQSQLHPGPVIKIYEM